MKWRSGSLEQQGREGLVEDRVVDVPVGRENFNVDVEGCLKEKLIDAAD